MQRIFSCVLILLIWASPGKGQPPYSDTVPGPASEPAVAVKHFVALPADSIKAWKNEERFQYVKNIDSLLKKKQEEQDAAFSNSRSNEGYSFFRMLLNSSFLQVLLWIVAIGLVGVIAYNLFINKGFFRRNSEQARVHELEEAAQPANDADYDALIHQSFKLADYRMAVRYLFLKTLWRLEVRGLLERSLEKTNFQYSRELDTRYQVAFASIVLKYEYVWYGHLNINQEQYAVIEQDFQTFLNRL